MVDVPKQFTLIKNKHYKAKLHLSGVETIAEDSMIKKLLEGFGFSDVIISGFGAIRHATGTWKNDDKTVTLDQHIESVVEEGEQPIKLGMSFTNLEMMKTDHNDPAWDS